MTTLRDRLFEPSDRHDVPLASWRGLLGGLFQAALYLVAFTALFVLGLLTDVVRSDAAAVASTLGFWGAILVAAVIGAGMVLLSTEDRVNRFWRVPAARLVTILVIYAAFWGLLAVDFTTALFAGPAFILARVATHVWLYLTRA
ncbi:MAG: hypothetical protein U5J98_06710 [Halobacteriales archaeon]|nr:hypothetical protein [Halobacteriales archaeon]